MPFIPRGEYLGGKSLRSAEINHRVPLSCTKRSFDRLYEVRISALLNEDSVRDLIALLEFFDLESVSTRER